MNVDVDSGRLESSSINLGLPTRAWQFTTMGNERDRPSLSLPAAQTAVTLLETFGWRASRQDPLTYREKEPTVLQPAILANGVVAKRWPQLSEDSAFVAMALAAETPADFVEATFSRRSCRGRRRPRSAICSLRCLADDFSSRKTGALPGLSSRLARPRRRELVEPLADRNRTKIRLPGRRQFEKGDPPTTQLKAAWRERAEDMVWALINSPEFVWIP